MGIVGPFPEKTLSANPSASGNALARHSVVYLLARGLPGVINLLAMAIYTRLLAPDDYGKYAIVIAGVGLAGTIIFQWLRLSLMRFYPVYKDRQESFLSTIASTYLALASICCVVGAAALVSQSDPVTRKLVALGTILLCIQSFYELNLSLAVIRLVPRKYGLLSLSKTMVAVGLGGLLAYRGYGAPGLIYGLIAGMLISIAIQAGSWRHLRFKFVDGKIFRELLFYGWPLSATVVLGFVVNSSDRFLLGWFLGTDYTGQYAAGYDIANQSLGVLMMIVQLAAYPLAVRALEQSGVVAARHQLSRNIILLLAVALPCAAALAVLAPNIAGLFLGASFRDAALALMPLIALGTLLAGIRSYYLDLSFQLGRRTIGQLWITFTAAIVNIILNVLWIPSLGMMGAAYATVLAYAVGLVLSWVLGRRVFTLPFPIRAALKILLATCGMACSLWYLRDYHGAGALAAQVMVGGVVYGLLLLWLNVFDLRGRAASLISRGTRT